MQFELLSELLQTLSEVSHWRFCSLWRNKNKRMKESKPLNVRNQRWIRFKYSDLTAFKILTGLTL